MALTLKNVPLYFPFCLAFSTLILGTVFFPWLRLSTFAPFLAILYNRAPFSKAMWGAFGYGLILDLLSSELRFGLHALNMTLTTALLYHQKKHFFEDKSSALSVFTVVIAACSTLIDIFLLHAFDRGITVAVRPIVTDVILMSIVDGLYAFLWFTCPMKVYAYIQKVGWKNLYRKRKTDEE